MFVVLEDARHARQIVSALDLLETDRRERAGAKNRLHYLLQKSRATDLSSAVLESIAQIDGSVVLDLYSRLLAFGAILSFQNFWSHPPGSNRRPADYESAALPAELGWPTTSGTKYRPSFDFSR
jgi:hypothetical protein